jgi:hypothetical protein
MVISLMVAGNAGVSCTFSVNRTSRGRYCSARMIYTAALDQKLQKRGLDTAAMAGSQFINKYKLHFIAHRKYCM